MSLDGLDPLPWLSVRHGYQPTEEELLEDPRDNKPEQEREPGITIPQAVAVRRVVKGRTTPRGSVEIFLSQNQATQEYGRRVRSSIDTGRAVGGIRARKVEVQAISPREEHSPD